MTSSDDAVQEVKRRLDLAQVIGRYVKLKRQGKSFVGLCPFHGEKTPSFHVHPDEGFFKCFGCDAKGDVFSFLERQTGQGFYDILRGLAEETGVVLEERQESEEEKRRRREKKRTLQVLTLAQTFFRNKLASDEGKPARAYLKSQRGLPDEALAAWGLGYGGAHDGGLCQFLENEGVTSDEALKAGVIAEGERGPYDFFRQRITFPIRSARGDVVTFAGRAFGAGAEKRPKYVNGPQTQVYDKGRVLYGLFESLRELKKGRPGVLVEGQLDVIAVHRAGLETAFAPCGTSLTDMHVDELKRHGERVVVCMDADAAGRAAAERAILMLLKAGFEVGWASLVEKDPDEMMRAGEASALVAALDGAPAALDRLIADAARAAAGSSRDRVRAIDRLLPFLAAPPREIVKKQYIRAAAKALHEDERLLEDEVEKSARGKRPNKGRAQEQRGSAPVVERKPTVEKRRQQRVAWTDAERLLARALLTHPLLAPRCGVLLDGLRNGELREFIGQLHDAIVRFHDRSPSEVLRDHMQARKGSALFEVIADVHRAGGFQAPERVMKEHEAAAAIDDFLRRFDARPHRERLREVQRAIAEAEERGDGDERNRLLSLSRELVDAVRNAERPRPDEAPALAAAPPSTTPPTPPLFDEPEPAPPRLPPPAPPDAWEDVAPPPARAPLVDDPAWDDDGWDEPV